MKHHLTVINSFLFMHPFFLYFAGVGENKKPMVTQLFVCIGWSNKMLGFDSFLE